MRASQFIESTYNETIEDDGFYSGPVGEMYQVGKSSQEGWETCYETGSLDDAKKWMKKNADDDCILARIVYGDMGDMIEFKEITNESRRY